jgi:hypothetical protein
MIDPYNQAILDYNRATELLGEGKWKRALPILKKCFKTLPTKEVAVNLGNCLRMDGDEPAAYKLYQYACKPNTSALSKETSKHAHNNLGLSLYTRGRDNEAIEQYNIAISQHKEFWDAWWNCSTAVLRQASTTGSMDRFKEGWEMYNARFLKKVPTVMKNMKEGLLYWQPGTSVNSIIILTEQGIGDSLMFGRYVNELKRFAKKVYVQCDPSLYPIFGAFCECTSDAINVDVEYAYPICSLAGCFDYIPRGDWLRDVFTGKKKFNDYTRPNIGIVYAGSATHSNNRYRSTNVERFHRLAKYANLYCLTPGFKSNKFVKSLPINSWTDTAEFINGLDLVISIDTSVAHMAGSLGAEAWMLQPLQETDFRWGWGVEKCAWYDSVRVIHNPGCWEKVFDRVEADLVTWIEARNANNIT